MQKGSEKQKTSFPKESIENGDLQTRFEQNTMTTHE